MFNKNKKTDDFLWAVVFTVILLFPLIRDFKLKHDLNFIIIQCIMIDR